MCSNPISYKNVNLTKIELVLRGSLEVICVVMNACNDFTSLESDSYEKLKFKICSLQ